MRSIWVCSIPDTKGATVVEFEPSRWCECVGVIACPYVQSWPRQIPRLHTSYSVLCRASCRLSVVLFGYLWPRLVGTYWHRNSAPPLPVQHSSNRCVGWEWIHFRSQFENESVPYALCQAHPWCAPYAKSKCPWRWVRIDLKPSLHFL